MLHAPAMDRDRFLFLRKFLRHGARVASVAPSSRALASAVCRHVSPDRPQTIVELGAGTGAITRVAAAKMHPASRLIAVEIDADFAALLERERLPRTTVVHADVRDLAARLEALGVAPGAADVFLSGLPTPSLPREVNLAMLETVEARLDPDAGVFSQLTVMPWVYWPTYRRLFEEVRFHLVPANFPPGGAYHCRRLRPGWRNGIPGR